MDSYNGSNGNSILSATDLQKRHELENQPDPFPSLYDKEPSQRKPQRRQEQQAELDTDSQAAFPSLGAPSKPASAPAPAWGAAASARIRAPAVRAPVYSETIAIVVHDRAALQAAVRNAVSKTKTKIEASTQSGSTSFLIKADNERDLEKAKRLLTSDLSPRVSPVFLNRVVVYHVSHNCFHMQVTLVIDAPIPSVGLIIGTKGTVRCSIPNSVHILSYNIFLRRDPQADSRHVQYSGRSSPP